MEILEIINSQPNLVEKKPHKCTMLGCSKSFGTKINICNPIVNNNHNYKVVALTWQDMSEFIQMKGKRTRYNI